MENKDMLEFAKSDVATEEKVADKECKDSDSNASYDEPYKKLIIPDIPEILKEKEVPKKKSKKGLLIGIGFAAFVLMLVVSVLTTVLNRVEIAGQKYEKDVSSIYLFDCELSDEDVQNLSSLENLSYLQLKNCKLANTDMSWLSVVGSTVELEACGLTDAHIASVDFSSARFTSFDVDGNNELTDLSPLANAADRMVSVSFSGCSVEDVSFLSGMTKLTSLYFDSNKVTDISAVSDCKNLQIISFNSNKVSSIIALSACSKLTKVSANDNELVSLQGLESASGLTEVEANGNAINDISALKNASSLKKVCINVDKRKVASNAAVEPDLTCLINSASNLVELYIDCTDITDFSILSKCLRLEILSANNCSGLTTLTYLNNCISLRRLSTSECNLISLDGIENLKNITHLDVSDNKIKSIDYLPSFNQNNVYLDLSNNLISSFVMQEQSFSNLAVYNNPITELDLSKTKGFKLAVDYNNCIDYRAVSGKFNSYYLIDCPQEKQDEFISIFGKSAVSFVTEAEYRSSLE